MSSLTGDHDRAVRSLRPDELVNLDLSSLLVHLRRRVDDSQQIDRLLTGEPEPPELRRRGHKDTGWIRRANVVGINIRTLGSYARVIAYALSLPVCQNAVHLLPFWETGVVASLYGMASWNINPEFIDEELATAFPALSTASAQLRFLVSVLHLLGKEVGLDVVPHTDRFSEIVLCNPSLFEWLRREGPRLVDWRSSLREDAQSVIDRFVADEGPAETIDTAAYSQEERRSRVLFGPPEDQKLRLSRRTKLIDRLYEAGLETAPATMGPPYRGLEVDPDSATTDRNGHVWYDYRFTDPTPASRAFGPLTRYAFYETVEDNRTWQLDFSRPREVAFEYLGDHIKSLVREYGFDFMRGDMSHVQMRPEGVPKTVDRYYDPLGYVKEHVREKNEGFAYFAESFLAPPGTMAYGDEVAHLEAAGAETTLGDLQSTEVGSQKFCERLARYIGLVANRQVTPALTVMTGDKDDPRFDSFYLDGNATRLFIALFVTDMPSYMALGFELRDRHPEPVANEYYTKLYVFRENSGAKATNGPYQFGSNYDLYRSLTRIRQCADRRLDSLGGTTTRWLIEPDPQADATVIAWLAEQPEETGRTLLCIANLNTGDRATDVSIPLPGERRWKPVFSTEETHIVPSLKPIHFEQQERYLLSEIGPGEGLVYE